MDIFTIYHFIAIEKEIKGARVMFYKIQIWILLFRVETLILLLGIYKALFKNIYCDRIYSFKVIKHTIIKVNNHHYYVEL